MNLVPKALIKIFKRFRISVKKLLPQLLTAIQNFHDYINLNVWYVRNFQLSDWKEINNITKKSFKNHKKSSTLARPSQNRSRQSVTMCPQRHTLNSSTTIATPT